MQISIATVVFYHAYPTNIDTLTNISTIVAADFKNRHRCLLSRFAIIERRREVIVIDGFSIDQC